MQHKILFAFPYPVRSICTTFFKQIFTVQKQVAIDEMATRLIDAQLKSGSARKGVVEIGGSLASCSTASTSAKAAAVQKRALDRDDSDAKPKKAKKLKSMSTIADDWDVFA